MEVEITTENPRPPWYTEIFNYLKCHNRIGPGKIQLADCDFFIVKPGRTLRIIKPTPVLRSQFYDIPTDRPESINENFITRWTKRPHSLNNCRCSFRHSSKMTITDDWIASKIDTIKKNLTEVEMRQIDGNIDVNKLDGNDKILGPLAACKSEDLNCSFMTNNLGVNDEITKNGIVKDLEGYIDRLLNEILNDTMKFMNDSESTLRESRKALGAIHQSHQANYTISPKLSLKDDKLPRSSLDINFMFPVDNLRNQPIDINHINININNNNNNSHHEGYTNQVFVGTDDDPDSLDFYLEKPVSRKGIAMIDCVDSGINSVETIEFPTESDLSLEDSLMQIIDEKFGRSSFITDQNIQTDRNNQEFINCSTNKTKNDNFSNGKTVNLQDNGKTDVGNLSITNNNRMDFNRENLAILEENLNDEKTQHDIGSVENGAEKMPVKKLNSVAVLCEKLTSKFSGSCSKGDDTNIKNNKTERLENVVNLKADVPIELKDYNRAMWKNCDQSSLSDSDSLINGSVCRRYKKPIIIFLHGFGSSAEVFDHQLRYFTQMGYSCIAPDMLGHGMSSAPDKSRDYHFDKLLNDLEVVLQHYAFKPGQKCVLVAHNYGCSFATALACKYSNEIHQLVLISGGGPTPLAPPAREGTGHCCLRIFLSPFLMCGLHREILYSARGRQHPYCGLESEDQWPSHMRHVLDGMIWPDGDYLFHRRICTPTLLIHGLRDNKVSLVQECQMERTIVKAYLEAIPMAGHTPMTDTPDQVNHMIHCFIDLWKRKKQ